MVRDFLVLFIWFRLFVGMRVDKKSPKPLTWLKSGAIGRHAKGQEPVILGGFFFFNSTNTFPGFHYGAQCADNNNTKQTKGLEISISEPNELKRKVYGISNVRRKTIFKDEAEEEVFPPPPHPPIPLRA